jgi:uncharacterized protein (TIGR02302 family)
MAFLAQGLGRAREATSDAKRILARAALLWERLWPALWPATGIVGAFVALAWLDLLPRLPGWLHAAILALFGLAILYALFRGFRGFALPRPDEALRRLERGGHLTHRPLSAMVDQLAAGTGDALSESLWRAHLARMAAAAKRARVGLPSPGLASRDTRALRALVLLLLAVTLPGALINGWGRIERALSPQFGAVGGPPPSFDVWVSPPEYTNLPPIYLPPGHGAEPIKIPAGSSVLARLHGGRGTPRLEMGDDTVKFERIDKADYEGRLTIAKGDRLLIRQGGRTLASWPLSIVADKPPEVGFLNAPTATPQYAVRVDYETVDDYGVVKGEFIIRRAGPEGASSAASAETIVLPLPLAGQEPVQRGTAYFDVTSHPWAGLPVTGSLSVTDAVGQTGGSVSLSFVLPERKFTNPLARVIAELRKRLTIAPEERDGVAAALYELADQASRVNKDYLITLGLSSAHGRLRYDRRPEAIPEAQALMWDLALRAEDGDVSVAARDLRAVEEALRQALERGAPDAEIEKLMNELRQAMDRYMQALREQLEQKLRSGQDVPRTSPQDMAMERQDLQRMLEQARDMMRAGARGAAQDLLNQLRNMLENMRAGVMEQPSGQQVQANRMMRDLRDLAQRQQQLMDQTFRQAQQGRPQPGGKQQGDQSGPDGAESRAGAQAQEGIRQGLGEFMRRYGNMGGQEPFNQAEQAMRDAAEALEGGRPGQAVDRQAQALESLRQGAREMAQRLSERNAGREGMPNPRALGRGRDGTGKPTGQTGAGTEDVGIPDEAELRRAREILDELRRRSGDRNRPPVEREYIDRLLPRY